MGIIELTTTVELLGGYAEGISRLTSIDLADVEESLKDYTDLPLEGILSDLKVYLQGLETYTNDTVEAMGYTTV